MTYNISIKKASITNLEAITTLFKNTIKQVNKAHYSKKQIELWAAGGNNLDKWKHRILNTYFVIAELDTTLVGFAYITNGNYFDGLFVHHNYQGYGIASKLLNHIEQTIKNNGYTTVHSDVSITALPFFKKKNYIIIKKQKKILKEVVFENYIVKKEL